MDGPSESLRQAVVGTLLGLDDAPDLWAEQRLVQTLGVIESGIRSDIERVDAELNPESARDLLSAVESWTSVISAAVARVYAPTSPWKRKVAGWAKEVANKIRWIADLLLAPLKGAAIVLGASSWSIGVNFPWGISVSLSWE